MGNSTNGHIATLTAGSSLRHQHSSGLSMPLLKPSVFLHKGNADQTVEGGTFLFDPGSGTIRWNNNPLLKSLTGWS